MADDFAGYARLYASLAPLCLAVSALPPFVDVTVDGRTVEFGSLWGMVGRSGGGMAGFAMAMLFGLVAFLVAGAFRPRAMAPPAGVAVCAAVIAALVLTKPNTGSPRPDLSPAGMLAAVVALGATALAITHLWHLALRRGQRLD